MSHIVWYPGHELILNDIVRAENCHLYDSAGKRYVDLESGVWCTSIGHGNPQITRVIVGQLEQIGHTGFNYSSGIVDEVALEFLSLLGLDGGKCVFLCSGSESVEYGVRVAQMLADRPLFMTMTDSYFGAYGSAMRKEEDEWFLFDWLGCVECRESGGCEEHWAAIPFDRIGGFLLEPGSSSGLVRFPPEKLIRRIVDRIRENDGFVLVNEVTTGVGRTGKWFGYQHYGFTPDIVATGKAIGNGYPVSVAALGPRVVERLGDRPVVYAQSHQNDPVGASVVREVIRVIREDGLLDRAAELSAVLLTGLERIHDRSDRIEAVRGRGLMAAIYIKDDAEASFTVSVHGELVRRGYIVGRRPGINVLRLDPALTIDLEDIEGFLATLEDLVTE